MLTIDIDRGRALAKLLYDAFGSVGIHGRTDMPEDHVPEGMERGSLEHILLITLTVSIDYQRDAHVLWGCARKSYLDLETRYLFEPKRLHEAPIPKVRSDLRKQGLSKKPGKDCAIWRTVGITFHKKWNGDPRLFLADCHWDAETILRRLRADTHLNYGHQIQDFPYLRGPKIGPLWLRMLRDNVGLKIQNLEAVPIPVDVHVARASLAIGLIRGQYQGSMEEIFAEIRRAWRQSVKGIQVEKGEMIALDLDEALWHLSKFGCSARDLESGDCRHYTSCAAKDFCIKGKVVVQGRGIALATQA